VLLRVLRGTASDGLTGIPERSPDGRICRPLLGVSRAEIVAYAGSHALAWREDASNLSAAYARSRLRTRWLPGLARAFNPGLLRSLGRLAEAQRRDSEWMESLVEAEATARFRIDADAIWIEPGGWAELPEALARRLAHRALRRAGAARDVSNIHVLRVVGFLRSAAPGRAIELPGGLVLERERRCFRLGARGVQPPGAC
jgi:tRNA(Ile)-lysidine synthase